MSGIPTWHQRAMAHPDHQSGMISEGMIRARMCEEIDDLRAEVERLTSELKKARTEVENLYDQVHRWVDDRSKAQLQADRLRDQSYELQRQRDEARAEVERLSAEIERRGERIKRLREALEGVRVYGPDADGMVWAVVQHPKIPTRSHVLVGNRDRMVSQALLEFEQIRRNALEGKP